MANENVKKKTFELPLASLTNPDPNGKQISISNGKKYIWHNKRNSFWVEKNVILLKINAIMIIVSAVCFNWVKESVNFIERIPHSLSCHAKNMAED